MKQLIWLVALGFGALGASAQEPFGVRFDHSTVLVHDLGASAAFYGDILQLDELETPWGPSAPIRFFSMGGSRQLHVGVTEKVIEPDKNAHLAFTVEDYEGYLRFLRDRGITYTNFPGSSAEPQIRPDGVRQVYLQDPDGNWIEINDAAHSP